MCEYVLGLKRVCVNSVCVFKLNVDVYIVHVYTGYICESACLGVYV
jgi:hypothetical protein